MLSINNQEPHRCTGLTKEDVEDIINSTFGEEEFPQFLNATPCYEYLGNDKETNTSFVIRKFVNGKQVVMKNEKEARFLINLATAMCRVKYYKRRRKDSPIMEDNYQKAYTKFRSLVDYELRFKAEHGVFASKPDALRFYQDRLSMNCKDIEIKAFDDYMDSWRRRGYIKDSF